jgi:hypothetical protein
MYIYKAEMIQIVPALYDFVQETDWLGFLNDLEYHLILCEDQPEVEFQSPQVLVDLQHINEITR